MIPITRKFELCGEKNALILVNWTRKFVRIMRILITRSSLKSSERFMAGIHFHPVLVPDSLVANVDYAAGKERSLGGTMNA